MIQLGAYAHRNFEEMNIYSSRSLLMKRIHSFILFAFLTGIIYSCQLRGDWQKVVYDKNKECDTIEIRCATNHQGEHTIQQCNVYIDNDTLFIDFPPELPAYWGGLSLKVHNNTFIASFDGVPFVSDDLSFETEHKQLVLQKTHYNINDTVCGFIDVIFKEIDRKTHQYSSFYIKGDFSAIVRKKDFNPFEKNNFMTFDFPTAVRELGEPLERDVFTTYGLPEFRVELLNYLPASQDIVIRELTWNTSETREISDEGKERLTIWYTEKNGRWEPVHFARWTTDMEF